MNNITAKKKLSQMQIEELHRCKYMPDGDMAYWDKMSEFYSDEPEILELIDFEKQYLVSLNAIPYEYPCHWKTERCYLDTVKEFNKIVGYESEEQPPVGFEDCLLEQIAAKFGIDIDINGDGITSFEKYRNKGKGGNR